MEWGPEETRRWESGLPVKTYRQGPGIMFNEDPNFSGSRPRAVSASMDSWAHSRNNQTRHTRRERSRQSFIKLISHYDKTGRLIVPSFSKEVAFEASAPGFNGTARPSLRYPPPDDSPEAVADRIAWATAHRYLSEYYDKYSETARMADTARQEKLAATRAAEASRQRPASAAPASGSRPGSAMAGRKSSRPASAAVRHTSKQDPALETLADETFPKDWASLTAKDLGRSKPWGSTGLGQHVVAGSNNTRLVGSRYRLVPEPADAAPQYTDYFGPVGGGTEQHTYYGRKYAQRPGGIILRAP